MPRHEVHSINNIRPRTGALAVEHAHTEQMHLLSHTKCSTADDAGHVRAMPVAIDADHTFATKRVEDRVGTPAKFVVRGENASIDDISVHTLTIVLISLVLVQRQAALIDAVEPP